MNPEFGQSNLVATVGLSTFVLGIALGPLFLGPLSEFYGRRPIYLVSWAMFLIWLIPAAVARNTATILTVRFIDGFAGSAFLSVAGGTVSDVFKRDQIQSPMTIISLSPFIGPSLGPLLGGFINYYTNWRWTYYVLIIWAFALLVAIVLFAPETYHPIKLREKARRLRKETGDDRWKAPIFMDARGISLTPVAVTVEKSTKSIPRTIALSLLRPFQLLALEPMCLLLSLLSAVLLGVIYLFFGAFPLVFGGNYGFNLWQTGLSFLGICVGMLAGAATNPVWHRVQHRLVKRNHGVPEPEFRLASTILGAVLILPIIGSAIFGCGTLLAFNGIFTFLVDTYPLYAASALAANSFLRCTFAAAFPLFGQQLYHGVGYQWASSLLAFITVALMPLPYVFFYYGKRLRQRSRFTASKP
ncbi:MFS general substrate transporter [Nemania sp. FL0031]|nr:MFS general substrate transporter [Nemania sp. FL0031]